MEIQERIEEDKIICSCRGIYGDELLQCLRAVRAGGIRMADIAYQQDRPDTFGLITEAIRSCRSAYQDELFIGAGNVLTLEQARLAIRAGAAYLISPVLDEEVIRAAREGGAFMIAGAQTPSEIHAALKQGADMVMLYPAGHLGSSYLHYVIGKGPLTNAPLIACGGVNQDNFQEFLRAGCKAAVIGQYLANKELIAKKDYAGITERARRLLAASRP